MVGNDTGFSLSLSSLFSHCPYLSSLSLHIPSLSTRRHLSLYLNQLRGLMRGTMPGNRWAPPLPTTRTTPILFPLSEKNLPLENQIRHVAIHLFRFLRQNLMRIMVSRYILVFNFFVFIPPKVGGLKCYGGISLIT